MTAYNYDKQEWVDGDEGRRERRRQVRKELEMLRSPRGREYADFLAVNYEDYLIPKTVDPV